MQSPKSVRRVANAIIAVALSTGVTAMFDVRFSPPVLVLPAVFVAFWSALFLFLEWLFITRPEEVKKNVPITSKEWRRRQKRFYDNLPR
jgi:hypothetical protein